jgi:thioredoxin-dependent peroxiredoxin
MLNAGDKAPDFAAQTDSGATIDTQRLRGKPCVIYFYPKDNTSGCTREACDFRDSMSQIAELNATIVGVSPDSPSSHDKFKAKQNLNFVLASDPDHSISEQYGAWGEKSMYGKKYFGIIRSTFLVGPDGIIAKAWHKVSVTGHVAEVVTELRKLTAK